MNRLIIIFITAAVLILSACGGAESRKAKYLQNANEYYRLDDCSKAKLDFKNVLQIDPKDVEGRIGLAKCLVQEQEWRGAYQLLASVLSDDSESIDAKFELAKFYLIAGESDKSYEYITDILKRDPQHPGAIALRGIFHAKNSTLVAARKDAQEAIGIDQSNQIAVTLMSALYLRDGENDKAIQLVKDSIRHAGDNRRVVKEFQILLIGLYGQMGRIAEAEPVFKELIEKYPDKYQYTNQLAAIYAQSNQLEKGEELLLESINASDNDIKRILSYISYIDKFRGGERATAELERYVEQNGKSSKLKLALGQRYLKEGKQKQAQSLFEELAKDVSINESNEAKNELAYINLKDGNTEKAYQLVEEVLEESPGNLRALMLRGTMALAARDAPQAITDFRTMLRDQPSNLIVIRQLATAYIMNGQEDLAKDVVQKAVEIDSSSKELNLLYARLQGQSREFDSAIDTVKDVLISNEDDLTSIKTLFDLQIASKDYSGAKETAEKIKLASEDNPLGYYLSGVLLQNEQKYDEAELEYLASLEKNPRANEPLSGLIKLYLSQGKNDKALAYLDGVIDRDPDYVVPYNLRGEIGIATKNFQMAVESFEAAIEKNRTWWIPYRGLSLAYAAQRDTENSMRSLERGIENGANIERLGVDLALLQYRWGKRPDAIRTYEKIIDKYPNSALAKNNLAMILVDDAATSQSITKALEFVSELQDIKEPASLDTVGWVYYKAGEFDKAVEILQQAVELAPDAAELHYHLGMAFASQGSPEKAKEHLTIATTSEQNFSGKESAHQKLKELM